MTKAHSWTSPPHIPGSNTYLTSAKQLFQSLTNNPNIQRKPPHNVPAFTACPSSLRTFIRSHPQQLNTPTRLLAMPNLLNNPVPIITPDSIPPAAAALPHWQPKQLTKTQLDRVAEALLLHESQLHPPDTQLCNDLASGKHPS